jgi:multidrug efflux pump subunit AcrA (membrane-fusion protein)
MATASQAWRIATVVVLGATALWWLRPTTTPAAADDVAVVTGPMAVRLIESGTLRPGRAVTYRSPLEGREVEVTFLAPEGLQVQPGDLVARLDPTLLVKELERTEQTLAQARLELRVMDDQLDEMQAAVRATEGGDDSIDVEEAAVALTLTERQLERAKREVSELTPLLAAGYITRDELDRAVLDAEQREAAARLARRRLDALRNQVQPQNRQKAQLQAAQQAARQRFAADRLHDLEGQVAALRGAIDACAIYADAGGLVVYEENMSANPRRRVRVGDRVTPSQGLITIPEIDRMVIETSVREVDVHQVAVGLPVAIRLDAFPDQVLTGAVELVGTLARSPMDRPYDEKRYEARVTVPASPLPLRPDMTARVEIRVAERKAATLLPITAVFERDGRKVAHVVRAGGVETRPLELGLFDGTYFEVLSGVAPGDRVRLIDVPPANTSATAPTRP